ncbi:hypothetical protein SVAN01_00719 [Stagonosporopsis vannaccii]|nr:hypothetical protein SVAN01_00719 [Stagonosporopsis vannaccii]
MTEFLALPAEIQRQCFNYLDGVNLKSMRLTSKALVDIATEALFDLVTIHVTAESAQRFTTLIENANIRRCIRTLYLDSQLEKYVSYDECCSHHRMPEWWKEAVAAWSCITLPNLRKIVLDTAYACVDDGHCAELMLALTNFVSHANVDALTIKHLQDLCPQQCLDFAQVSKMPKKLNFLITTWTDDASDYENENSARHSFFNQRLNASWLDMSQSQLTHLTLHCNTYWGVFPRWQLGGLHFPSLKSLAFSKWTIGFDWQLDFITSHGQTLEQLNLTDCPILHASRMERHQSTNAWQLGPPPTSRGKPPTTEYFFDTRWHHALLDFQHKLSKLKHFSMGRGPVGPSFWGEVDRCADEAFDDRYELVPCIDFSRYAIFDFGEGAIEYESPMFEWDYQKKPLGSRWSWLEREKDEDVKRKIAFPDCSQEDQEALEGLLRVVRERARICC